MWDLGEVPPFPLPPTPNTQTLHSPLKSIGLCGRGLGFPCFLCLAHHVHRRSAKTKLDYCSPATPDLLIAADLSFILQTWPGQTGVILNDCKSSNLGA